MKKSFFAVLAACVLSAPWLFCAEMPERVFYANGARDRKAVAFTFDDGPGVYTEQVLEILKKYDMKATFFMMGTLVKKRPETALKVAEAGHEIGNHLYFHPNFFEVPENEREQLWIKEAEDADLIIEKATGIKPYFIRMPYGYDRPWVKAVARSKKKYLINWSFGYDWHGKPAEEVKKGYIGNIVPGAIFLFHDGGAKRQTTIDILPAIIEAVKEKGYEILTISELLNLKRYDGYETGAYIAEKSTASAEVSLTGTIEEKSENKAADEKKKLKKEKKKKLKEK